MVYKNIHYGIGNLIKPGPSEDITMNNKIILAAALTLLVGLVSCMPPCPPGTELSPDGVCIEEGAEPAEKTEVAVEPEKKPELEKKPAVEEKEEEPETTPEIEDQPEIELEDEFEVEEVEIPDEDHEELSDLTASEKARQRLKEYNELYQTKVKSYEFTDPEVGTYKIKGNLMKLVLLAPRHQRNVKIDNETVPLFYYDAIYHDFSTGITQGFCEGLDSDLRRSCQQSGIENIPLDLKPADVQGLIMELPHDWLENLFKESVPKFIGEGKYYVHDRAVSRIDFQEPDGFVYFDPLNGLPIRLEVMHEGKKQVIDFKDLIIDTVKDKELINRPYSELGFDEHVS